MKSTQKRKLKAVLDAIEEIFSDTSVPIRTTLELLNEIQTDLEFKTGALKVDIRRSERE